MPTLTHTPWPDADREAAMALLQRHRATSLFLLNNLEAYGPRLGESLNSANYHVLLENGRAIAVHALTRRGNLLVQFDRTPGPRDLDAVLDAALVEPVPLGGLIGDWATIEPLLARLQARRPDFATTVVARDRLFERPLAEADEALASPAVRPLQPGDFDAWDALNGDFLREEGFPVQGSREERRTTFLEKVALGAWWGYVLDGRLVSLAGHNARVGDVAQVGGVYTPEAHRRRGYSGAVMRTLIADSHRQGFRSLVLFTGEQNLAAQAMYRALGFEEIGGFGLVFGGWPA